jgi:hypothetical protein
MLKTRWWRVEQTGNYLTYKAYVIYKSYQPNRSVLWLNETFYCVRFIYGNLERKVKNTYFDPHSTSITEDRYKRNILFVRIQVISIRMTCRNEITVDRDSHHDGTLQNVWISRNWRELKCRATSGQNVGDHGDQSLRDPSAALSTNFR